jgi:hypothetical protein
VKFEGVPVRYVDQDGILTNEAEGRVGMVESGIDHTNMNAPPPPVTAGVMWDNGQEPTTTKTVGLGSSEGVPIGNHHPTQPVGFPPVDLFTDLSVLFFGPSAGFNGIGDQPIAGEATTSPFSDL